MAHWYEDKEKEAIRKQGRDPFLEQESQTPKDAPASGGGEDCAHIRKRIAEQLDVFMPPREELWAEIHEREYMAQHPKKFSKADWEESAKGINRTVDSLIEAARKQGAEAMREKVSRVIALRGNEFEAMAKEANNSRASMLQEERGLVCWQLADLIRELEP